MHFPLQCLSLIAHSSPFSLVKASLRNNWVMALQRTLPDCCRVSQIYGGGGGRGREVHGAGRRSSTLCWFYFISRWRSRVEQRRADSGLCKRGKISSCASRARRSTEDRDAESCSEHGSNFLKTKSVVDACSRPLLQSWCCLVQMWETLDVTL